uniref:VPS9 domain-containing protein n=1 Tax=Steinernema glaseri TaxID=37863 RepID=A0A1I7ZAY5_9BILA
MRHVERILGKVGTRPVDFAMASAGAPDRDGDRRGRRHFPLLEPHHSRGECSFVDIEKIFATLRKTGRLLLWLADNQASGGLVKDISNLAWRSFLGRGWTTLAVFSDTVAVIQKNDCQTFDFPLVWLEPIQSSDNKAIIKMRTPEADFDIEFFDACGKTAFVQACSYWRSGTLTSTPPIRRTGAHKYSNTHSVYRNCSYVGSWQLGKPHGLGVMVYPDGKTYKGHFHDGAVQGFGEMSVPSEPQSASIMNSMFFVESPSPVATTQKCDVCVGKWANGQMNGLVAIKYGDGSSYEGYCKGGLRHGHGVMRSSAPFVGATIYVGSWREGVKHGYGVHSTNSRYISVDVAQGYVSEERYLGMWQDGLKHGLGALVTIDSVFHEGVFEKDKMIKGRLAVEGDSPMDYEGDFDNVGVPSGKGALQVTPFLRIEGSISGNLLSGEVKINAGTLLRTPEDKRLKGRSMEDDGPHESAVGKWTVLPDDKWVDIFAQFELEYYGVEEDGVDYEAKTLWSNLVGSLAKIKAFRNLKLDDEMERIPDFEAEWSNSYYAMARQFWVLATGAKGVHPLHRLLKGITEVFTCSYNNIGTHPALYDQVVLEFRSLIRRTYGVIRRLFVNLPAIDDMYEGVPQRADITHRDGDTSDTPSVAVTSSKGEPLCERVPHYTRLVFNIDSLASGMKPKKPKGHD